MSAYSHKSESTELIFTKFLMLVDMCGDDQNWRSFCDRPRDVSMVGPKQLILEAFRCLKRVHRVCNFCPCVASRSIIVMIHTFDFATSIEHCETFRIVPLMSKRTNRI